MAKPSAQTEIQEPPPAGKGSEIDEILNAVNSLADEVERGEDEPAESGNLLEVEEPEDDVEAILGEVAALAQEAESPSGQTPDEPEAQPPAQEQALLDELDLPEAADDDPEVISVEEIETGSVLSEELETDGDAPAEDEDDDPQPSAEAADAEPTGTDDGGAAETADADLAASEQAEVGEAPEAAEVGEVAEEEATAEEDDWGNEAADGEEPTGEDDWGTEAEDADEDDWGTEAGTSATDDENISEEGAAAEPPGEEPGDEEPGEQEEPDNPWTDELAELESQWANAEAGADDFDEPSDADKAPKVDKKPKNESVEPASQSPRDSWRRALSPQRAGRWGAALVAGLFLDVLEWMDRPFANLTPTIKQMLGLLAVGTLALAGLTWSLVGYMHFD